MCAQRFMPTCPIAHHSEKQNTCPSKGYGLHYWSGTRWSDPYKAERDLRNESACTKWDVTTTLRTGPPMLFPATWPGAWSACTVPRTYRNAAYVANSCRIQMHDRHYLCGVIILLINHSFINLHDTVRRWPGPTVIWPLDLVALAGGPSWNSDLSLCVSNY
jgi:hypothetical protein